MECVDDKANPRDINTIKITFNHLHHYYTYFIECIFLLRLHELSFNVSLIL